MCVPCGPCGNPRVPKGFGDLDNPYAMRDNTAWARNRKGQFQLPPMLHVCVLNQTLCGFVFLCRPTIVRKNCCASIKADSSKLDLRRTVGTIVHPDKISQHAQASGFANVDLSAVLPCTAGPGSSAPRAHTKLLSSLQSAKGSKIRGSKGPAELLGTLVPFTHRAALGLVSFYKNVEASL